MWKFDGFIPFLYDLVQHPLVGEIIIVDNNETERPLDNIFKFEPKIRIESFGRNIFVNPVWNYGVKNALYDKICVMNDDMVFDTRVFNRVYPFIKEENGTIGINIMPCPQQKKDGQIRIVPYTTDMPCFGFGLLFFTHRNSYEMIPEGLELFFGDNFIFDNSIWRNKPMYVIMDLFYYTPFAATCSTLGSIVGEKFDKEKWIYKEIIKSKGHNPKTWCKDLYGNDPD
jgi:hypothetical protein